MMSAFSVPDMKCAQTSRESSHWPATPHAQQGPHISVMRRPVLHGRRPALPRTCFHWASLRGLPAAGRSDLRLREHVHLQEALSILKATSGTSAAARASRIT